MLVVAYAVAVATLLFILGSMVKSIRQDDRPAWRHFALSIAFMVMFFGSLIAQAIAEWQVFTDEQRSHGEQPEMGDFLAQFGQSTFENWQSEFLQLFSFVVLAALYIHKGSAESRDGTDEMQASLERIEQYLGTKPQD